MDIMALGLFLIVGLTLFYQAYRLFQGNRKVLHDYHYKGIHEDALQGFQKDVAKALCVLGFCILFFGAGSILLSFPWLMLGMIAGFIIAITLLARAQNRHRSGV